MPMLAHPWTRQGFALNGVKYQVSFLGMKGGLMSQILELFYALGMNGSRKVIVCWVDYSTINNQLL